MAKENIRVFIVDDSALLRNRLASVVSEAEGAELAGEAADSDEAADSIRKLRPDVVILDIRLQTGSGIDVLREIKKDKQGPVVIVLTNYPYSQYREKCMALGADFFLDKSSEFEQIPELLEQLVQK